MWPLFCQPGARPRIFGESTDQAIVQHAREVAIPAALDHLEGQLPDNGFVFGSCSFADLSLARFFRTAAFVRYSIDATRWPRMAALLAQVLALPVLQKLARLEDCMLRLPLAEQRGALLAAGAPLSSDTRAPAHHGMVWHIRRSALPGARAGAQLRASVPRGGCGTPIGHSGEAVQLEDACFIDAWLRRDP